MYVIILALFSLSRLVQETSSKIIVDTYSNIGAQNMVKK